MMKGQTVLYFFPHFVTMRTMKSGKRRDFEGNGTVEAYLHEC